MTATAAMTEASPATATASAGKPALAQKDAAAVTPKTGRNRWLAPAAAAFVIVLCAVFYAVLGLPGTARHPSVTAGEEAQGNTDGAGKSGNVSLSQEQIQRMVDEMTEEQETQYLLLGRADDVPGASDRPREHLLVLKPRLAVARPSG